MKRLKTLIASVVLVVGLLILHGCTTEADRQVFQQDSTPAAIDPRVEAMKPMLGVWEVDLDGTSIQNSLLPDDVRGALRRDLEQYPFELRITGHDYISRSRSKTVSDHYTVLYMDGEGVTIKLESFVGPEEGPERTGRLRVQDGRLLIIRRLGDLQVTVVMTRQKVEGK